MTGRLVKDGPERVWKEDIVVNLGLMFWSLGDWKKANLGKRLSEFKYKPLIVPALKNHVPRIYGVMTYFSTHS